MKLQNITHAYFCLVYVCCHSLELNSNFAYQLLAGWFNVKLPEIGVFPQIEESTTGSAGPHCNSLADRAVHGCFSTLFWIYSTLEL